MKFEPENKHPDETVRVNDEWSIKTWKKPCQCYREMRQQLSIIKNGLWTYNRRATPHGRVVHSIEHGNVDTVALLGDKRRTGESSIGGNNAKKLTFH